MGDFSGVSLFSTSPSSKGEPVMQDQQDLLIEKPSSTTTTTTTTTKQLSPGDVLGGDDKASSLSSKDLMLLDSDAHTSCISPTDIINKDHQHQQQLVTSSTSSIVNNPYEQVRVPSLWADDATTAASLHAMPVNGSLATAFQNFPSGQGGQGLFSSSSGGGGNRRAITASHNFPQQQQQPGSRHLTSGQQQQQQQQHPVYLQSKGYPAWSGGGPPQQQQQQQQWSQQQQGQGQTSSNPALAPWNRGRSVPNLPPLHSSLHAAAAVAAAAAAGLQQGGRKPSPTGFAAGGGGGGGGHHQGPQGGGAHQSSISPVKFRRSTSYPGKGYPPQPAPTFEVTQPDERDLLQLPGYQQVCWL